MKLRRPCWCATWRTVRCVKRSIRLKNQLAWRFPFRRLAVDVLLDGGRAHVVRVEQAVELLARVHQALGGHHAPRSSSTA
jgi:hypothetical protein